LLGGICILWGGGGGRILKEGWLEEILAGVPRPKLSKGKKSKNGDSALSGDEKKDTQNSERERIGR